MDSTSWCGLLHRRAPRAQLAVSGCRRSPCWEPMESAVLPARQHQCCSRGRPINYRASPLTLVGSLPQRIRIFRIRISSQTYWVKYSFPLNHTLHMCSFALPQCRVSSGCSRRTGVKAATPAWKIVQRDGVFTNNLSNGLPIQENSHIPATKAVHSHQKGLELEGEHRRTHTQSCGFYKRQSLLLHNFHLLRPSNAHREASRTTQQQEWQQIHPELSPNRRSEELELHHQISSGGSGELNPRRHVFMAQV